MHKVNPIITLLLAAVVAWSVTYFTSQKNTGIALAQKETAYERVVRTNTLRCGYVVYPPMLKKDINTGKLSGIGHDIVTKIAELTKLKIEWTMETNWVNYVQDLQNGKFDAMCTLDFFPPVLVGRVETTQALFLTTMGLYKKKDAPNLTPGFRNLNDANITISAMDGSISMLLHDTDYPNAKLFSMPAGSDYSLILENVANSKADVAIVERSIANAYMKNNPNKLDDITGNTPIVAYPYILPVAKGEIGLSRLFDQAIMLLQFNGYIEKTLSTYAPGDYMAIDAYKLYKTN